MKVVGLIPSIVYSGWTDIFHIYCCRNCNICLKKTKINEKEVEDSRLKKEKMSKDRKEGKLCT